MGLFNKSIQGFTWMAALTGTTKVLALIKIGVLARILTPAQFGAVGLALLVLGLLEVLTETGINIFLIQEKSGTGKYLNSAWVASIFRGLIIALVIILLTPFVASFFRVQNINHLLYIVALTAFVRGFINPMTVVFQKELKFKNVFIFKGLLYFIDTAVAISVGLLTRSESALVLGMVVAAITEVFISFVIFTEKPVFKFEKEKLLTVINSGKWVTGAGLFNYLFQNIDNIVVGKVLGPTSLGFYQQSYSIATLPVTAVGEIFNKVMFPSFVNVLNDVTKLRKMFMSTLKAVVSLSLIFGSLIYIFANEIITIILGPDWLVIEPILKVLIVFGVLKSMLNSTYSLFLSLKMQKTVMFSELMGIMAMLVAIYPMVTTFGPLGAGFTAILAVLFSYPVAILNVKKIFYSK